MRVKTRYYKLKLFLVPIIGGLPVLRDGSLSDPKTYLGAIFAAAIALYALVNESPRSEKESGAEI